MGDEYINGRSGAKITSQEAINRVFDNILSQPKVQKAQAEAAIRYMDVNNPMSYMQSAFDVANYNTQQSQALAREQMQFQERANAKAMDFNATEAQKTRDWTQLMSDTAHQREVQDLIAAGLNPILSANQGASTGSAASAQGVTSSGAKGNVDTGAVSALTNAYVQARNIELQEKNIDAQLAMNLLNNETNRYAADKGAYTSMYNSQLMSSASRYGASQAAAAAMYGADKSYQTYYEGLHGTAGQTGQYVSYKANQAIDQLLDTGTGKEASKTDKSWFGKLFTALSNTLTPDERVRR